MYDPAICTTLPLLPMLSTAHMSRTNRRVDRGPRLQHLVLDEKLHVLEAHPITRAYPIVVLLATIERERLKLGFRRRVANHAATEFDQYR